jgi:ribonuclease H2 subunit A
MEASDQSEQVAIGIDEAGRGCVLGPLVYGMACWPLSFDVRAQTLGLKDSK